MGVWVYNQARQPKKKPREINSEVEKKKYNKRRGLYQELSLSMNIQDALPETYLSIMSCQRSSVLKVELVIFNGRIVL